MKTKVTGHGLLAHHFHGSYWASLAIQFESPEHARDALRTLGEPWRAGNYPHCLVCEANGGMLDRVKAQLAKYGANPKAIDSVRKSIDQPWVVTIPVTAGEQLTFSDDDEETATEALLDAIEAECEGLFDD